MNKHTCRALAIILLIAALLCLFSCDSLPEPKSKTLSFTYFDTVSTLYDYSGLNNSEFTKLCENVKKSLQKHHELFDIYNEYPDLVNLATINNLAGKGPIRVKKEIIELLLYSKEMYSLTGGKINVAFGSVLKIWHDYRTNGTEVPDIAILKEAALHTDINDLIIDEENLTVELSDPLMSLDVGAIAKGYAVEMIAKELEEGGFSHTVIDVGGNLRAIGAKKDGSGWKSGVKNPKDKNGEYVYFHNLKNEAMSTSGGYERFYTVNEVRYHHIINPDTLMPENYYLSVTVIAPSSALSDSLSTAVFNMNYDDAELFAKKLQNVKIILVLPSGEVKELCADE